MSQGIQNAIIFVLGGLCIWALFFRNPEPEVKKIIVPVRLTPQQLDSMELAISVKIRGELKPVIKKVFADKTDTTTIKRQLNEIISLKDSLRGKAELNLEFHGFVGENQDTLDVVADFVSDSISVVFRPKQRDFEVVHTEVTEGRNFIQRIRVGAGVGGAIIDGKIAVIPSIGLFYDIFGK